MKCTTYKQLNVFFNTLIRFSTEQPMHVLWKLPEPIFYHTTSHLWEKKLPVMFVSRSIVSILIVV